MPGYAGSAKSIVVALLVAFSRLLKHSIMDQVGSTGRGRMTFKLMYHMGDEWTYECERR